MCTFQYLHYIYETYEGAEILACHEHFITQEIMSFMFASVPFDLPTQVPRVMWKWAQADAAHTGFT